MDILPIDDLTTVDVCRLAGCTFRQADYWVRAGVLRPAGAKRGSGSMRRWSYEQAAQARVCTVLASLGATQPVLASVLDTLAACRDLWSQTVLVTTDGRVWPSGVVSARDGWLVDLAGCRAYVGAQPVVWAA